MVAGNQRQVFKEKRFFLLSVPSLLTLYPAALAPPNGSLLSVFFSFFRGQSYTTEEFLRKLLSGGDFFIRITTA
jgi:hypothetical protein